MGRQKYKFKRGDTVMVSFPQEVLTEARRLEREHRGYVSISIDARERGNNFSYQIAARRILRYEGKILEIVTRNLARYSIKTIDYSKMFLPHTCLKAPTNENIFWRQVANEKFQSFTIPD